jgi:alpha-ketoglutarate-dependent taurine dioxygenase
MTVCYNGQMSQTQTTAPALRIEDGWLRVRFNSQQRFADYHFRWLRHNCDLDRHPTTGERIIDSSELPERLDVRRAVIEGEQLIVHWAHDDRISAYPMSWLEANAYAENREQAPAPPSDVAAITLDGEGLSIDAKVNRARALLSRHGAAVVRRSSTDHSPPEEQTESIIDAFSNAGLRVIETHFGRVEDLRTDNSTNKNTDQLGYTDAAIELHTDQPFLDDPPRFQVLQSIRAADWGGDNYLVDAFAAARYLGSRERRDEALLRSVAVRFDRKQRDFQRLVEAPIFSERASGPIVRYSYFTMAPHRLPFDEMEAFYRAYDRFARIVRDPRHQYRFSLKPGDFLVYDNHRMLHARTSFAGARWVRGIYLDS